MSVGAIVVGFDGSKASYRALAMAIGLARTEHRSVHACLVTRLPVTATMGEFYVPGPPSPEGLGVDDDLAGFVTAELARAEVQGDFTRSNGEVTIELERLAASHSADMIVVGRSTHPHLHLGGVPRQLLAHGRVPVLVVP